jgi:hypothetical protein
MEMARGFGISNTIERVGAPSMKAPIQFDRACG